MSNKRVWLFPLLLVVALLMILAMLRLAIWQLDRATQKQVILDSNRLLSEQAPTDLAALSALAANQRFLPVTARGRFLPSETLYLDNQVFNKQVGYQVITPFRLEGSNKVILVARGWLGVGASRSTLPSVETPSDSLELSGRLNLAAAAPPLWNDEYSAFDGARWQYLDMSELNARYQQDLFPLVLELAPEYKGDKSLMRAWDLINDAWVAKHKAYAFQWFAMAAAFFVACIVLLVRRRKLVHNHHESS